MIRDSSVFSSSNIRSVTIKSGAEGFFCFPHIFYATAKTKCEVNEVGGAEGDILEDIKSVFGNVTLE